MINILEIHVEVPHQKFQRGATEMTLEGNFQIVITLNLMFKQDVGIKRKGQDDECWSLLHCHNTYSSCHAILSCLYSDRVAVYLDWPAGILSFYSLL